MRDGVGADRDEKEPPHIDGNTNADGNTAADGAGAFIITAHHAEEKRRLAEQMRRQMTPSERLLWQQLRANRLGGLHFRRQQVIDGFIADFFCHAAGLVVEVDGGVHADRQEYDLERDRILTAHGLRVLRVTNGDLKAGLKDALRTILLAARERLER